MKKHILLGLTTLSFSLSAFAEITYIKKPSIQSNGDSSQTRVIGNVTIQTNRATYPEVQEATSPEADALRIQASADMELANDGKVATESNVEAALLADPTKAPPVVGLITAENVKTPIEPSSEVKVKTAQRIQVKPRLAKKPTYINTDISAFNTTTIDAYEKKGREATEKAYVEFLKNK